MIQKLERVIVQTTPDGVQTTRLPNNEEIMHKLNEVIEAINVLSQDNVSNREELGKVVVDIGHIFNSLKGKQDKPLFGSRFL